MFSQIAKMFPSVRLMIVHVLELRHDPEYELECEQSYDNQQLTRIYDYNLFLQCTVFE